MRTLEIENLNNLLNDLLDRSRDLITYGNTNERFKGWGMLEVIDFIKFSYIDNLREKIDNLLVSYLEGDNYMIKLTALTKNVDKYELIILELRDYQNDLSNSLEDVDPSQYYIDNIIRIINQ